MRNKCIAWFLSFRSDGSRVWLYLDSMLSWIADAQAKHALRIDCENEIAAQLLRDHLQRQYNDLIREAVQKAYADGYRDGRAKRGKNPPYVASLSREVMR